MPQNDASTCRSLQVARHHASLPERRPASGGTNTNVVPGKVVLKLDRRMIPEENPAEWKPTLRAVIADAVAGSQGITGRNQAPADGPPR